DVLSDCQAEIPADSTWCSLLRVGCSNYKACCINDVFTFKHHCKYWPRSDEIHQFPEEWLILVFLVMCFGKRFRYAHQLCTCQFETFVLQTLHNWSDEISLYAIRLDH